MEQKEKTRDYAVTEFIDEQLRNLESIVPSQPFLAFPLLSIIIELLGKCLSSSSWDKRDESEKDFCNAINTLNGLKQYRKLNTKKINKKGKVVVKHKQEVYTNLLYTYLRCNMVHAFLPSPNIRLTSDNNDLDNKIIGCQELYNDIKSAWEELNQES